jgi:hypothetical protein
MTSGYLTVSRDETPILSTQDDSSGGDLTLVKESR